MKPSQRSSRAALAATAIILLISLILPLTRTTAAGPPIYPDLVTPTPAGLRITREWLDGAYHYLLRFDNTIVNNGGRLELTANLSASRDVYQNVYDQRIGGTRVVRTKVSTDLIYHPQHNHFHFEGIANYELLKKNSTGRYLSTSFRGTKTSYCIIDYVRMSSSARTTPQYEYCNDSIQGLSAGWGDLYYSSLPGQWIDLGTTMLPNGDYALQSTANPQRKIKESNTSNNAGIKYFSIRSGSLSTSGQTPECVATPSAVHVGDTLQVSCTRINAGTTVDIRWRSTGGPILQSVVSGDEHKALASVSIPEAASGAYPIFAVVRSTGSYYGAIVNISASLSVSQQSVAPGDQMGFLARGFSGGEPVGISVDGQLITTKTSSVNGTADGSFSVPPLPVGTHTISAAGESSGAIASAQIAIGPSLRLEPAFAHVQSAVSPTLSGFAANEQVDLAVQGGQVLLSAQTGNDGSASGAATSFTLPSTILSGSVTIVGTGASSGVQATAQLLVLAAGADTPTPTATTTSTPVESPLLDIRKVTTSLNMRSGPGTSYSVLRVLASGTLVTVTGPGTVVGTSTWMPIRLDTGTNGWVSERYLVPVATTPAPSVTSMASTSATAAATRTETPVAQTVETRARLNLRTGPGTTYSSIEILPAGTLLTVTGAAQTGGSYTWLPVRKENGVTGWVASSYVTAVSAIMVAAESATSEVQTLATSPSLTNQPPQEPSGLVRLDDQVLRWLPEILSGATASGVAPEIIAAVIELTSGGDPNLVSANGSVGLMQLTPGEFAALGITGGWHDPATNVSAGAATLAALKNATGSLEGALAAYFGDDCSPAGMCGLDFAQIVLSRAAVYAPVMLDPGSSPLSQLPDGWSPEIAPYQSVQVSRPFLAEPAPEISAPADTPLPAPTEPPRTETSVAEPPEQPPPEASPGVT